MCRRTGGYTITDEVCVSASRCCLNQFIVELEYFMQAELSGEAA